MKTAAQRETEFRRDLAELLARHDAELDITDDGKSYGMHSAICIVSMNGRRDADGDVTEEYTEFRL